jgi:hypothetical protein
MKHLYHEYISVLSYTYFPLCQADAFTGQIPRTATTDNSLTISGIPAFNKMVSLPRGGLARGILLFLDTGQFNPTLTA